MDLTYTYCLMCPRKCSGQWGFCLETKQTNLCLHSTYFLVEDGRPTINTYRCSMSDGYKCQMEENKAG